MLWGGWRLWERRVWLSRCTLEAISWSLILICHSAALNTNRQILADTRGRGDRKQLRKRLSFFCEQTIPALKKISWEFSASARASGGVFKGNADIASTGNRSDHLKPNRNCIHLHASAVRRQKICKLCDSVSLSHWIKVDAWLFLHEMRIYFRATNTRHFSLSASNRARTISESQFNETKTDVNTD